MLAQRLSVGTSSFLVSSQLWNGKVPFFRGFFFSISMIKSPSVALCLLGSLFLSLSVWIVNHGEREFSPSVPLHRRPSTLLGQHGKCPNSLSSAKRAGTHTDTHTHIRNVLDPCPLYIDTFHSTVGLSAFLGFYNPLRFANILYYLFLMLFLICSPFKCFYLMLFTFNANSTKPLLLQCSNEANRLTQSHATLAAL